MEAWVILLIAACLEVEGDALVRWGLKLNRIFDLGLGGLVLFIYAVFVNTPDWDFSQLLGIYIVLFFIISQLAGYFIFGERVTLGRGIGGLFIAAGGVCMMVWK